MFFNRSKLSLLFSHSDRREDKLFADIYGCDDIKKLFRMALESSHTCSILLTGPAASAKTLFLQSLIKLKDCYFVDCSNATKSGILDYLFANKPKYLLLDELDKLSRNDQTALLNLIETGVVSETKYNRTRRYFFNHIIDYESQKLRYCRFVDSFILIYCTCDYAL